MPPKKKKARAGKKSKRVLLRDAFIRTCIAGGATFLLLGLSVVASNTFATLHTRASILPSPTHLTIGMEYEGATSLTLDISRKGSIGYVMVSSDRNHALKISLPASWHRTEVRGVPLQDVTSEPPTFGFVRWTLPPGAGMTLKSFDVPDFITFTTPSKDLARITVNAIDVIEDTLIPHAVLLNGKSTVNLWEE